MVDVTVCLVNRIERHGGANKPADARCDIPALGLKFCVRQLYYDAIRADEIGQTF